MGIDEVILTAQEYAYAVEVGESNRDNQIKLALPDHYNFQGNPKATHIDGALYEMVWAKWLGYAWGDPYGCYRCHPDYGAAEVRGSDWNDQASLFVHPGNDDESFYPLITRSPVDLRHYRVRGFLWGHEAKQPEYWREPVAGRPVYQVPRAGINTNLYALKVLGVSMNREQDIHHWEAHGSAAPGRQLISVEWPNGFRALFSFPENVDMETFERVIERYRIEVALGKHSRLRASD
jgi:hypothetical protein